MDFSRQLNKIYQLFSCEFEYRNQSLNQAKGNEINFNREKKAIDFLNYRARTSEQLQFSCQ